MNTTRNRSSAATRVATVLGAGSLLLGAAIAAPAAAAAAPVTTAVAAVTPAASAPLAGDSTEAAGARTKLVDAWYQQFLGRDADAGSKYWVVRLRTEAPSAVLADLLRTPEHAGGKIVDRYSEYLGRTPEGDPDADYWFTGVYDQSFPLEWVEQNLLASPEYEGVATAADPGSPVLLVASWYRDVLGRDASAGEAQYWALYFEGNPGGDASNLDVLREMWYTPEAVANRITRHYSSSLRRTPGPGEIAYWSDAERRSDIGVQIAIATSEEYRATASRG